MVKIELIGRNCDHDTLYTSINDKEAWNEFVERNTTNLKVLEQTNGILNCKLVLGAGDSLDCYFRNGEYCISNLTVYNKAIKVVTYYAVGYDLMDSCKVVYCNKTALQSVLSQLSFNNVAFGYNKLKESLRDEEQTVLGRSRAQRHGKHFNDELEASELVEAENEYTEEVIADLDDYRFRNWLNGASESIIQDLECSESFIDDLIDLYQLNGEEKNSEARKTKIEDYLSPIYEKKHYKKSKPSYSARYGVLKPTDGFKMSIEAEKEVKASNKEFNHVMFLLRQNIDGMNPVHSKKVPMACIQALRNHAVSVPEKELIDGFKHEKAVYEAVIRRAEVRQRVKWNKARKKGLIPSLQEAFSFIPANKLK